MNCRKIKYVGFYDEISFREENRNFSVSATGKMDYILKILNKNNFNVELISPSWTNNDKCYKGRQVELNSNSVLKIFPTLPWKGKLLKIISVNFSFVLLVIYLLFTTEKNDKIIVYHSRWLSLPILLLKKIKKSLVLILEVEEIYDDVKPSKFWGMMEYKLFSVADRFIFPTELLNQKLNTADKPHVIIHGTYQVEDDRESRFEDDKIHIVYAGTFDPRKGGAFAAAAAEYLPKYYHVHIIGFGTKEQIEYIQKEISVVSKKTEATITYDGFLKGEEYISFLQKCDIGLSTQIPDAIYSNTSFPSKILSYMANGLRVVSVRIKAVEISAIGNKVWYYEDQSPQSIAKSIISIDINKPYDGKELIKELNDGFEGELEKLLRF